MSTPTKVTTKAAAQPGNRDWRAILLDFLERAGWSAGQVFFATLLAGGTAVSVANLPWKYASVLALSAAVASIVLTAAQYLIIKKTLPFWQDLLVRLAKTFLASLGASFAAAHPFNIMNFDWPTALNLAAVAVLTALAKGLLAGSSNTGGAAAQVAVQQTVRTPSTLPNQVYFAAVQR